MNNSHALPVPEAVIHLWDRVKRAWAANGNLSPREIDRMATVAGCELAETTIAGWFKTWSVVPAWEKFEVLIKALAAEHDEDWRSLHRAALIADRERKSRQREERRRKELGRADALASPEPIVNPRVAVNPADQLSDAPAPAPATSVSAAVPVRSVYGDLYLHLPPAEPIPGSDLVLRQLPAAVAHFTGRVAELAKLDVLLT